MTIKKKDIKTIAMVIARLGSEKTKKKLAYAFVMNKKILEPHLEAISEMEKFPQSWIDLEEKRHALCAEYSHKDATGKPKTRVTKQDGEIYDLVEETKEEFEEKMKQLREDNQEAYNDKAKHEVELLEALEEEVEIDFYMIDMDFLPEEITSQDMEILFPLLKG